MKLTALYLVHIALLPLCISATDGAASTMRSNFLNNEDNTYWDRILRRNPYDASLPTTPPPTPKPTRKPPTTTTSEPATPSPSSPVSLVPSVHPSPLPLAPTACRVQVELSCSVEETGQDCNEALSKVSEPTCLNCAPTKLCFLYTGNACETNAANGLISCTDTSPALVAAEVLFKTPTDKSTLRQHVVQMGSEICVQGDDQLPPQVEIMIRPFMAAMTNEPEYQTAVLDTSCSGAGLTLKDNFGALQLVHYENDCQGIQDCLIPIQYKYVAENTYSTELAILEFIRTLNGETKNLLMNGTQTILPAENITESEIVVADCCSGELVQTNIVTVSAEGRDGSKCSDQDEYVLIKQTSMPTAAPEPSPTPVTFAPVAEESPAPSAIVTSLPPEEPSSTPSELVFTPSPSVGESLSPSKVATSLPSEESSSFPSAEPSSIPSGLPSISASSTPSGLQSSAPSATVTVSPSERPSLSILPSDECSVQVNLTCVPSDGSASDCGDIVPPMTICQDRPFAMVFKYIGGDCSQSFNIQSPEQFQCLDFQSGPPDMSGQQAYIVATDTKGGDIVYFAGFVLVGEEYTISDGGNNLEADMNITVYSSNVTSPENMLQTVTLDSSCMNDGRLFLKDRFGASQLVIFVNEDQGVVSCFVNATYEYIVRNTGEDTDAILQSLISETNFGTLNLTDLVDGTLVNPGDTAQFNVSVVLDMTMRQRYEARTTLVAQSPGGLSCSDTDFYEFVAGKPLPPSVPTALPSLSPTQTPLPTPDPEDTPCELLPLISCSVTGGLVVDCNKLGPPTRSTCVGNSMPIELVFVYTGGDCPGNNNARGFRCNDSNGGPADRDDVWVEVTSGGFVLFNAPVDMNGFITVRGAFERETDITVSTIDQGEVGILLQTMRLRTTCDEQDDLTLLNTFGSLQLVGFTNPVSGTQAILAEVEITYAVTVSNAIRSVIQSAISIGAFAGERLLRSTPSNPIGPRDVLRLGVERETLNLVNSSSSTFDFELFVNGTSFPNPALSCNATGNFSFTIG